MEVESLEWTARQTRSVLTRWSSRSLSSTLDRGHEGHICEVLQEDGRSSMHRTIVAELCCRKKLSWVIITCCLWLIMIAPWSATLNYNTDWCLFLQVKNKPWLPWVYTSIQHHCEHLHSILSTVPIAGAINAWFGLAMLNWHALRQLITCAWFSVALKKFEMAA